MGLFHSRDGQRLDGATKRNTPEMSSRSDIDVAGVRVEARHLPELVTRLRRAGEPYVAHKVQQALGARTIHVTFGPFEREAIVRAIDDRPRKFSELYAVLLRELKQRPELVDDTPLRRPGRSPLQAAHGVRSPPRPENDAADASTAWSTGTAERHRDERHTARDPPAVAGADEVEAATAELPADRRRQRRQAHMGDTDRQMGGEPPTDSAPCHPGVANPGEVLDHRQGLASANRRRCQSAAGMR